MQSLSKAQSSLYSIVNALTCSFSIRLAVTSHTNYVRSAGRKQRHFQTTSLFIIYKSRSYPFSIINRGFRLSSPSSAASTPCLYGVNPDTVSYYVHYTHSRTVRVCCLFSFSPTTRAGYQIFPTCSRSPPPCRSESLAFTKINGAFLFLFLVAVNGSC